MRLSDDFGGRNDKFGNEFERRWVIEQALRVLDERALSLLWEPIGFEGQGIDLSVTCRDSTREVHQCKMKNRSEGKWTAGHLNGEGVLTRIKQQLIADGTARFVFVSRDPVPVIDELADRARGCDSDASAFFASAPTSGNHRTQLNTLCKAWDLDQTNAHDQTTALDILRRVSFAAGIHDRMQSEQQERLASLLVDADGRDCVDALGGFLSDRMGNAVHADELREFLRSRKMPVRNLLNDPGVASGIDRLVAAFNDSLATYLIGGELIPRTETTQIIKSLFDDNNKIICVHGDAGSGKSGVLYELVQRLRQDGIPVLPIRFDEQRPDGSLQKFSESVLDIPAPPPACLRQVTCGRLGILVIDQLDAIRWTGAHSGIAWRIAKEMIDQTLAVPNLRIVVACRTFDLTDDRRFREWLETKVGDGAAARPIAIKQQVNPLSELELTEWLAKHSIETTSLPAADRELLRNLHCLFLWCDLYEASGKVPSSVTKTSLLRAFWKNRIERATTERGLSMIDVEACMTRLVTYLDCEGRLDCPMTIVSQYPAVVEAMRALHVLHKPTSSVIRFVHQSYLDFQVAERVIRNSQSQSPVEWVLSHDQSLFRRDQLRQVLILLRDEDPFLYSQTLRSLITTDGIRFHLQHLALSMLRSQSAPIDSEFELVTELLSQPAWRVHVLRNVLFGSAAWFKRLSNHGILKKWMEGSIQEIPEAIWLLRGVIEVIPVSAEELLKPHWPPQSEDWIRRFAGLLSYREQHDTEAMFHWRLELIDQGHLQVEINHIEHSYKETTERMVWLLGAFCRATLQRVRRSLDVAEAVRFDWRGWRREYTKLRSACQSSFHLCWSELLPVLLESVGLIHRLHRERQRQWKRGGSAAGTYDQERSLTKFNGLMFRFLAAAIGEAVKDADWVREQISVLSSLRSRCLARLQADLWHAAPSGCADDALSWLAEKPSRFELGRGRKRPPEWPARLVLRRHAKKCSESVYKRIEATVLAYFPRWEFRRAGDDKRDPAAPAHLNLDQFGRGQLILLHALRHDRSSQIARGRLQTWLAKHGRYWIGYSAFRHSGGSITFPIPRERLHLVQPPCWLWIMETDWDKRPNRHEWKQISPDVASERSHRHFSEAFQLACHINPSRMAEVTQVMPLLPTEYVCAALRSFGETRPPEKLAGVPTDWMPAPIATAESLIERISDPTLHEIGWALCHMVQSRSSEPWSRKTIDTIFKLALEVGEPADQFEQDAVVKWGDGDQDDSIFTFGGVRDSAAWCLNNLLFRRPELALERLNDVRHLMNDSNLKVRAIAQRLCLHFFNESSELALDLFLNSCSGVDDLFLANPFLMECMSYLWRVEVDRIAPLLERMIASEIPKVAKRAAKIAIYGLVTKDCFRALAQQAIDGTVPQRSGAAQAIADLIDVPEWRGKCFDLFVKFCHDREEDVSARVSQVLRSGDELLQSTDGSRFANALVNSPAFERDSWSLVHGLEQYSGSLLPYAETIEVAVRRFCQFERSGTAADSRDHHMTDHDLAPLLLRFYQQTEGPQHRDLRNICLDAWDNLLKTSGFHGSSTQLNLIDAV